MDIVYSVRGVPIRLTAVRWFHIVENHDDLAGRYDDVLNVVENPELVIQGYHGSLIAVRSYGQDRYLMVINRELSPSDGFIVTAYFAGRVDRRKAVWRQ